MVKDDIVESLSYHRQEHNQRGDGQQRVRKVKQTNKLDAGKIRDTQYVHRSQWIRSSESGGRVQSRWRMENNLIILLLYILLIYSLCTDLLLLLSHLPLCTSLNVSSYLLLLFNILSHNSCAQRRDIKREESEVVVKDWKYTNVIKN